jgi:hypothetical protein
VKETKRQGRIAHHHADATVPHIVALLGFSFHVAKIGTIFQKCKFLRDFLNSIIKNYFLHFFSQALASFFSQVLASFFSQQDLASFFSQQALASFFSQQALASFFSQQALSSFFSQACFFSQHSFLFLSHL